MIFVQNESGLDENRHEWTKKWFRLGKMLILAIAIKLIVSSKSIDRI